MRTRPIALLIAFLAINVAVFGVYNTWFSVPENAQSGVEYNVYGQTTTDSNYATCVSLFKDGSYYAEYWGEGNVQVGVSASSIDYGNRVVQWDIWANDEWSCETATAYVNVFLPARAPIGVFDSASTSVQRGTNLSANGWAADYEMGAPVSHIDYYIDGSYAGQAALGGSRPDVQAAKLVWGGEWETCSQDFTNSGWNIAYNTGSLDAGTHSIRVVAYDNQSLSIDLGTKTFSVFKASQVITFGTISAQSTSTPLSLNAMASSGLPVGFTVVAGPATISGNGVTLTGPGTVTIMASQAGNGSYLAAANVSRSFAVAAGVTDNDHDGMDDAWEIAHGLNPTVNDAASDLDADGTTNLAEFLAGRNPANPADAVAQLIVKDPSEQHYSITTSTWRIDSL